MAVKAVNDLVRLDRIVSILLVFGAYPQITKESLLSLSIIQRAKAICKATKEVWCLYAER